MFETGGRNAAHLLAVCNCIGSVPGFVGVHLSGWLVKTSGWDAVFLVVVAMNAAAAVAFVAFASDRPFDGK